MSLETRSLFEGIAFAWDEQMYFYERKVLCQLAGINDGRGVAPWDALSNEECEKLVFAFRRAVELGAACGDALVRDANSPRQRRGTT